MTQPKQKNRLSQFEQYSLIYDNGFYHLPYSSKSPEELIESFANYPFVKHDKEQQSIYTDTPFSEGGFYYQKLEEGCWILNSKIKYKENVAYDLVYDKPDEKLPEDKGYYILSLNDVTNKVKVDKKIHDTYVCFPHYSWTFFKPKVLNYDLNFKGSNNRYISLYFNEEWLQRNLAQNDLFSEGSLDVFMASQENYLLWPLTGNEEVLKNFSAFDRIMNIDGEKNHIDLLQLKLHTINLIFDFFRLCKEQNVVDNHFAIDYNDKFNIHKVENYLANNLFNKFPGIEFLAKKFKISESKLKVEFKFFFGKSIFQYFQEKQMVIAKELIEENKVLIKELSYKFGYENTSKFTAAFKKHHGILPSDCKTNSTIAD